MVGQNRLSWFFGSAGQIRRVIGLKEKNKKRGKNQAKKKLGMEKEGEIKHNNSKNQISMSLEWRQREK